MCTVLADVFIATELLADCQFVDSIWNPVDPDRNSLDCNEKNVTRINLRWPCYRYIQQYWVSITLGAQGKFLAAATWTDDATLC